MSNPPPLISHDDDDDNGKGKCIYLSLHMFCAKKINTVKKVWNSEKEIT